MIGKDVGTGFVGRVGGVAQVCFGAPLRIEPLAVDEHAAHRDGADGRTARAAIVRVSEHVSLLGELATMIPVGTQGQQWNGGLVGGGAAAALPALGFDFTLLHALDSSSDAATIPFLAMTWRP